MKIYYSRLQIELTRRYNQSCAHCCRGEAQNVDLTKEIIDDLFEKNDIYYIGTLLFSGGEPTLNGEILEYTVDKIIEKEIMIDRFLFGINGLSYSEAFVNGLNKLQNYILLKSERPRRQAGILMVSQDQFHQKQILKLSKNYSLFLIFPLLINKKQKKKIILPYGRAFGNGLSKQQQDFSRLTDYQKNYTITEYEGNPYCVISYQYIAANGNIINDGTVSYNLMDEYALGNVQQQKVEDIYNNGPVKKLIKYRKKEN